MDLKKLPIRELLQLCLDSGGEDAWTEFLGKIQGPIAAVISRTLGKMSQRSTVDDLIQNTWVKLFDNDKAALRRIKNEHENSIYAYVRSAAFHMAHDHIRGLVPDVSLEELVSFEPANSISELPRFNLSESGVEGVLLRLTRHVKGKLDSPLSPASSAD